MTIKSQCHHLAVLETLNYKRICYKNFSTWFDFTRQMYNAKKSKNGMMAGPSILLVIFTQLKILMKNAVRICAILIQTLYHYCKSEHYQQFLQAHYIWSIWKNTWTYIQSGHLLAVIKNRLWHRVTWFRLLRNPKNIVVIINFL